MKPVAFDYARVWRVEEALRVLNDHENAKILAGAQTLGPLLNLRLAQPSILVDITRVPELTRVEESRDAIDYGACITHAAFEDARVPDAGNGLMQQVAAGIGYRAVRSRGTIGGSIAHADPAADWVSALVALGADVLISGPNGGRRASVVNFIRGAMMTDLGVAEIIDGVRVKRLSPRARCGYAKICRKTGEFADAIGVAVHEPECARLTFVSGATSGRPILLDGSALGLDPSADRPRADAFDLAKVMSELAPWVGNDAYDLKIHAVALRRAFSQICAA